METDDAALVALAGSADFPPAFADALTPLPSGPLTEGEQAWVRLHNAGRLNLLRRTVGDDVFGMENFELYQYTRRLVRLLPGLAASIDDIVGLFEGFAASRVPDGAILDGINGWFRANPDDARKVVAQARTDDGPAPRLLPVALAALDDVDGTSWFVAHRDGQVRLTALFTLSRLPLDEPAARAVLSLLGPLIGPGAPDDLVAAVVDVLVHVIDKQPALATPVTGLLGTALDEGGPATRRASAYGLLRSHCLMASGGREAILTALVRCGADEQDTIAEFDSIVREAVRAGFVDAALGFCEQWGDGALTGVFLSVLGTEDLARFTVAWLVDGDDRHCAWLSKHFGPRSLDADVLPEPAFEVSPSLVPASLADRILGPMKAVGWLILDPLTTAAILLAFLRASTDEARHHLGRLLAELLLDRHETEHYVRRFMTDGVIGPIVSSVLADLDAYKAAIDAMVPVPELRPADEQRRIVQMLRQREAIELSRRARDASAFARVISTQTLLHGTGAVHAVFDANGQATQTTMQMHSVGYSLALPRMGTIDPIGDDMRLRSYRVARRTA